ncbi:MAG: sensor domain-containing diguanylate cyclase [Neorhizobium sp.]|nr:sensor domain-containing diguanylate cyclase [Neorhizobium sp.]
MMHDTGSAQMSNDATHAAVSREAERLIALERLDMLDAPKDEGFERVVRLIKDIFSVEIGLVSLIDAHRQWYQACAGIAVGEMPRSATFCRVVVDEEKAMVIEDATKDRRFADHPFVTGDAHIRFYAGMPLKTREGFTIGTLCAIDRQPRQFSGREERILEEIAGTVMDRIELLQFAATDGLTNAMTRRAFRTEAEGMVTKARRKAAPLSVITLDIDHFKRINDTSGHAAGDEVLKAVAAACRDTLGPDALFGRLGGEEFAIVLPGADRVASLAMAETLRAAILAQPLRAGLAPGPVTASFGLSTLSGANEDIDTLLAQADAAMYRAKHDGRNRCIAWNDVRPPRPASRRRRVVKAGTIIVGGEQPLVACTIRTLGEDGAGLKVSDAAEIPDAFVLVIDGEGREVSCRVTTRDRQRLDVSFSAAYA